MMRTFACRPALWAVVLILHGSIALAQNETAALHSPPTASLANNQATTLLSTLPEADTLIYINTQRILNEAAPMVLPEADLQKLRQQFNDLKQSTGIDPARIDFVTLIIRFRRPGADLSFLPPEFLVVASGDFSADSLVTLARLAMQGWSEEKYGAKALTVMTLNELASQAEKNPILKSFTKVGLAPLSTNTIAVGNVNYLKAAVDAAEGRDRINPETLNSLLRDSTALMSVAGSPFTSFAKSFGLMGTETNPRGPRCESKLGDLYASVTMEGSAFKLRGMMNADNPDTAKIINNLLSSLLQTAAAAADQDKKAQTVLRMLKVTPRDSEITLEADIPQQMVADFIREQAKPKPATESKKPGAKPTRKRTRRR